MANKVVPPATISPMKAEEELEMQRRETCVATTPDATCPGCEPHPSEGTDLHNQLLHLILSSDNTIKSSPKLCMTPSQELGHLPTQLQCWI